MMRIVACVLLSMAGVAAAAEPSRPLIPVLDAAGITRTCDAGLARAGKMVAAMAAAKGGATFFDEWNRVWIAMQDASDPIGLLENVHPDKAVRDAAEPCDQKFTRMQTAIYQDERLLARVRATRPANPHQVKLKRDLEERFEDSGVALPGPQRQRAKEIFDRLTELGQQFARHVRDDATRVAFTPAEMAGLPESYLRNRKRDPQGNYVLGLEDPAYIPFMSNAADAAARQRYYLARLNKGGAVNLAILEEMYRLRKELAGLYGLPTFAHYSLRRKMSGSPDNVQRFLTEVRATVGALEKAEIDELRAEKSKDRGTLPADTRLDRWDVSYYQERIRRARFDVDQEKLRRYFPMPQAVDYTLLIAQKLYGVKFREVQVPVWHPDVRYFDVLDGDSGRFLSGFYLDLYPREGKYAHAAAFSVRGASRLAHRTPLSVLVTNFNRDGLTQGEFRTLMHEFGHVLHGVLSRTDYVWQSGTRVKRDFVEAPSQMFEEWSRREQPLALFAQACPECPRLTPAEIARLDEARRFGSAFAYARQLSLAAFDMALSTDPRPPLEVWKEIESGEPLGVVEGAMFPAAFGHLAGGYAAGYYGYMWSQVLALDMLSPFRKDMLDARVGRRYRDLILSQGGQEDEMAMVRKFLGREPSNEAFLAEITGKR